jgi:hypothetical protein
MELLGIFQKFPTSSLEGKIVGNFIQNQGKLVFLDEPFNEPISPDFE